MLYWSGPAEVHMYDRELFYLFLYNEPGQAGVQLEPPFYPDAAVVGQPHCVAMIWAPVPHHRTVVATCASGNFWTGA